MLWQALFVHSWLSHTQYKCQVCPPQSHYLWMKWQSKTITTLVCLCMPCISTRSNCCSNCHGGRTNSSIFWLHTRWSAKQTFNTDNLDLRLTAHPPPPPTSIWWNAIMTINWIKQMQSQARKWLALVNFYEYTSSSTPTWWWCKLHWQDSSALNILCTHKNIHLESAPVQAQF